MDMMMKKAFVTALFAFVFLGCSTKGDPDPQSEPTPPAAQDPQETPAPDGLQPPVDGNVTWTETTNHNLCNGPATERTKIEKGIWHREFRGDDGSKRRYIYEFDLETIYLQAFCSGDGIEVRTRLSAPAIISTFPMTMQWPEADLVEYRATGLTNKEIVCQAEVHPTGVMNYSFVGPCLQTEENGKITIYAPSH